MAEKRKNKLVQNAEKTGENGPQIVKNFALWRNDTHGSVDIENEYDTHGTVDNKTGKSEKMESLKKADGH